jgi:DNA polymerase-3 subunit epsilon
VKFLAIDFETADYGPDSACAIGLVRVERGVIVSRAGHLIRPPREDFVFSYLHGITWEDVEHELSFRKLWPTIAPMFHGVDFLAAHNASFDRNVLYTCCHAAEIDPPDIPFQCSMVTARNVWGIYPTRLPDVCRRLRITLNHHDPSSDAEACARIMIRALEGGR